MSSASYFLIFPKYNKSDEISPIAQGEDIPPHHGDSDVCLRQRIFYQILFLSRKGENEKIFTRLGEVVFRSWSSELELESGGLGVGGGAKVRASGYGVFAEVPRGEAFGHRRRYPFLGTDPTIANKIKGLTGSVPNFRGLTGPRPYCLLIMFLNIF